MGVYSFILGWLTQPQLKQTPASWQKKKKGFHGLQNSTNFFWEEKAKVFRRGKKRKHKHSIFLQNKGDMLAGTQEGVQL